MTLMNNTKPADLSPSKAITLEKATRARPGALGKGSTYDWTYKSLPDLEAIRRARLALARDHPGEDPLNWSLR